MTRTSRCGLCAAILGSSIALWLSILVTFFPWRYFYENQRLFTAIAPPAVFFSAVGLGMGFRLFIVLVVIAQNAVIYGVLGLIAGKIWGMIQPAPQSTH